MSHDDSAEFQLASDAGQTPEKPRAAVGVGSGDGLAELKRELADAVREYEVALMRNPMDEEEIRRAVDKCVNARKQFNAANDKLTDGTVRNQKP
jgi:hypothetical protein